MEGQDGKRTNVKKKIGVTLPPDLHGEVKATAARRGLNVEQAYEQALRSWVGSEPDDPFYGLKQRDKDVVQAVIAMLREHCMLAETVKVLTKKYEWDKRQGVKEPNAGA